MRVCVGQVEQFGSDVERYCKYVRRVFHQKQLGLCRLIFSIDAFFTLPETLECVLRDVQALKECFIRDLTAVRDLHKPEQDVPSMLVAREEAVLCAVLSVGDLLQCEHRSRICPIEFSFEPLVCVIVVANRSVHGDLAILQDLGLRREWLTQSHVRSLSRVVLWLCRLLNVLFQLHLLT